MKERLREAQGEQAFDGVDQTTGAVGEAMSGQVAEKARLADKFRRSHFARNFKRNWTYMLFLIPAVVVTFIFAYIPIYGILIAFQDYMPGDSILNGYWIGFQNFEEFFGHYVFWDLMINTFLLCILGFIIGYRFPSSLRSCSIRPRTRS